jgi:hypothetical protein
MKNIARLLLPVLAVGIAACGSSKPSQPASSSAEVPGMPRQTQSEAATPKPSATSQTRSAKRSADAARPSSSHSRRAARPTAGVGAVSKLPASTRQYPLIVTAKGITPAVMGGDVVPARVPFSLMLVSADGKSHTVTLAEPAQRSVKVVPNHPGRISFQGLAPGRYALRIDGTNLQTTLKAADMSKVGTSGYYAGATPAK